MGCAAWPRAGVQRGFGVTMAQTQLAELARGARELSPGEGCLERELASESRAQAVTPPQLDARDRLE